MNIIGNPNVGKSTLMNALVGEKLSIITPKAQTTRHRIIGIVNEENYQIIFSDTPGVVTPHYKLHEAMMKSVDAAVEDADVMLLMTEVEEDFSNQAILDKISETKIPLMILINKVDLSDQQTVNTKMEYWKARMEHAEVIPVSALLGFNIEKVMKDIIEKLPEAPPFYSKDELTDKPVRFFISEIIREKALNLYHKEVPYSLEVKVEEFKADDKIIRIKAFLFVSRESQKQIVIGHQGKAIKKLGIESRKDIEEFVGKQVYLELSVKVNKDWRNNPAQLKRFGYEN